MVVQHGDRTLSPGSSQFCCAQIVNRPSGLYPHQNDTTTDSISDRDTGRPSGATMDVCRNIISWRRTKRTLRPVLFPSYPRGNASDGLLGMKSAHPVKTLRS